jgi:hypothetical protein
MPDLDLDKIMEMAQNAQAELQKAQDNLDTVLVEGASGGGLVSYDPPNLVLKPLRPLGATWARDLAASLRSVTTAVWAVSFTDVGGGPSLQQQERIAEEQVRAAVLEEPNVRALLDAFPEASLESIQSAKGA